MLMWVLRIGAAWCILEAAYYFGLLPLLVDVILLVAVAIPLVALVKKVVKKR